LKASTLSLILLCLLALAVVACAGGSSPAPTIDKPTDPALAVLPTTINKTMTPLPVVASATIPKPTATFVPLITPSPTPTGDRPSRTSVRRIGVMEAKALAEAGDAILVDVRTQATYEQEHIAGALSVPLDEGGERLAELDDDVLIIFYCA
jgi:hypothetical protein